MNKSKNIKDIVMMCILLIFCFIGYFFILPAQISDVTQYGGNTNITSRTFPNGLIIVIAINAIIQITLSSKKLIKIKQTEKNEDGKKAILKINRTTIIRMTIVFALFSLYEFLFVKIGFVVPTIIVLPSILVTLKCKKWFYYIGVLIFAFIMLAIFRFLLGIDIPLFM